MANDKVLWPQGWDPQAIAQLPYIIHLELDEYRTGLMGLMGLNANYRDIVAWCRKQWPHTEAATWHLQRSVINPRVVNGGLVNNITVVARFQREEDATLFKLTWCE